jgi:soluble lytic murein transglycosylase-like protein
MMNFRLWSVIVGAVSFLFAITRSQAVHADEPSAAVAAGLTITENEALGLIALNKLAYPSLGPLPDSVVMATIAVESSFDPNAIAPAGEVGLMQVIVPRTWQDVINRATLTGALDPYRPKDNILVGMHYLRLVKAELKAAGMLTGNEQTDWALIDQAYNMGPAGVKQGRRNETRMGRFIVARAKYQRAGLA